jgi:small-conductance mechanosensitive channel
VLRRFVLGRAQRWAATTPWAFDDFLASAFVRVISPLAYYGVLYLAVESLALPAGIRRALAALGAVLLTIAGVRLVNQAIHFMVIQRASASTWERSRVARQARTLWPFVTVVTWGVGIVFLLDNLGFRVSAVVAGLGITGIAVALGAQALLADLFSYLAITLDRPFELDDFIVVGDYMGTVEHIGIKTTRLRSLSGEQLIFCNKDLTDSRVRNYRRMRSRRVEFRLQLAYENSVEKLREIPSLIARIVEGMPRVRFERAHFVAYQESGLQFDVVYHVLTDDYGAYMDAQQGINLALKQGFAARGVDFAAPTATLYVQRPPANGAEEPASPGASRRRENGG